MNPKELRYTKDHEWVKVVEDIATVGITDHAQRLLTDIVFVELPATGKEVKQKGNIAVVESVKSVSDIFSPLSGKVAISNKELEKTPELVNKDPYGKGWIAKLSVDRKAVAEELRKLMTAEQYEEYVKEK
jgi:glycine cleavage system H protein